MPSSATVHRQSRTISSLRARGAAAERATAARAEEFTGISQEIREPLDTIAGAVNVMIDERFGALGNERYAAYLKDIRAAAERAVAILDGIADISNIESGRHELKLVGQNLNEMVEQCVGMLQPQANRERVIIRTSLAHALPQVIADTQALRQITMNIVTSSIRSSKGGGQVIVSTAPGDNGGAILRVRDSGHGPAGDGTRADTTHRRGAWRRRSLGCPCAGRGQSRAVSGQDNRECRHADRSRVLERAGACGVNRRRPNFEPSKLESI